MLPVRKNQGWLPSIFSDFFDNDWIMRSPAAISPAINVIEQNQAYEVEVAAPGLTKEDFSVGIENNILIVSIQKKEEKNEEKEGRYIHREFSSASFNQRMSLPDNIDSDKIEAKVEHGVLRIKLPKLPEEKIANKMIEVK